MGNKTVSIRCENCGGTMMVDDNNSSVLMCPYCGSKELIRESDEFKIEKIKNETYREIELKKLEMEERGYKREQVGKTAAQAVQIILKTLSKILCAAVILIVLLAIIYNR